MNKIKHKFQKAILIFKERGIKGVVDKIYRNVRKIPDKTKVLEIFDFIVEEEKIPLSQKQYGKHANDDVKILNWIIPDVNEGSGGHLNIFRFISNLENMGFHSRIYIFKSKNFRDNSSLEDMLRKHFPILDERVEAYWDVKYAKFAHATIATSWITAYFVRRFNNTISKFYFVQDYEPYFYANGSEYEFAQETYRWNLRGITAGDWLKDKLREEFGMRTESFGFSYDKDLYTPQKKEGKKKRVFFYARPVTPRRDFEMGMLALDLLCKRMPEVEVVFAGWDLKDFEIPFPHKDLGIVSVDRLSKVYAQCELCLIISNTNLSLLPLEVMASNSVAVCSKGKNSTWLVNEENSILVDYNPIQIADTLEYYLKHEDKLNEIRQKGLAFAKSTSWEKEAEKVKEALLKGIAEDEK